MKILLTIIAATFVLPLIPSRADSENSSASSPSPTPAAQGDPFIKKAGGKVVEGSDNAPRAKPSVNIYFTMEVYAMAPADAENLLAKNDGANARYQAALGLVKSGKARLETLMSNVTESGVRSQVMQAVQVPYPTEYDPFGKDGVFPAAFEVRNTGDTLEEETVLSTDNSTCDITISLSSTKWEKMMYYNSYLRDPKDGGEPQVTTERTDHPLPEDAKQAQPVFSYRKLTTSISMPVSAVQFLGTLNGNESDMQAIDKDDGGHRFDPRARLVFGRITTLEVPSLKVEKQESGVAALETQLSVYSMDREAARKILAAEPQAGGYYAAVKALADKGEAASEYTAILKSKSGTRAGVENIQEFKYAMEYRKETGKPLPVASVFETAGIGSTMEMEATLGTDSVVNINASPLLTRIIEGLHMDGAAGKFPGPPLIEKRNISTMFSTPLGEQTFIGTLSPSGNTGLIDPKDPGRIWLAFIRTIEAKP